jgi:hypothetical protein
MLLRGRLQYKCTPRPHGAQAPAGAKCATIKCRVQWGMGREYHVERVQTNYTESKLILPPGPPAGAALRGGHRCSHSTPGSCHLNGEGEQCTRLSASPRL